VSNSTLAARISALIDKWNGYKNALRDMLTKQTGTVDMEDGTGAVVTLPTFPALQKAVTGLTDDLTGAAAKAAASSSQASAFASASLNSANDADTARAAAVVAKDSAADSAATATTQAGIASTKAAEGVGSATTASTKAAAAAASAVAAAGSATTSQNNADSAGFSAASAQSSKDAAATSQGLALQYANAPVNVQVSPGNYSAFHWAEQARLTAVGALIYRGKWSAASGTLPAGPKTGDFYIVSVAGTVSTVKYGVGDMLVYDGDAWDRIDNQTAVNTVAGRTGNVVIAISDLAGLQGALDAKAPAASPTFTGTIGLPSTNGVTSFALGTGDNATYATHNVRMHLHWGLGIEDYAGTVRGVYDARTGTWDTLGGYKVNGQAVWHAGNLNPANYIPVGVRTVKDGTVLASGSPPNIAAVVNNNATALCIANNSNQYSAAIMSFLRDGQFGAHFGIDTDNQWKVGGWSMGAAAYRVIHEGVTNWNCPGQVSGNSLTTGSNGGAYINGNGSGLQHNGPAYFASQMNRLYANGGGWLNTVRIFVQGSDPGAAAGEGDLWIW